MSIIDIAVIFSGFIIILSLIVDMLGKCQPKIHTNFIKKRFSKKSFMKALNSNNSPLFSHRLFLCIYNPSYVFNPWTCYKLPIGCMSNSAYNKIYNRFQPLLKELYKDVTYNTNTLTLYAELGYELKYIIEEICHCFTYVNEKWRIAKEFYDTDTYDSKAKECWAYEDILLERLDIMEEYFLNIHNKIRAIIDEDKKAKQIEKDAFEELSKKANELTYSEIVEKVKNNGYLPFVITENVNVLNKR